jgi:hypothetical protein
MKVFVSLSTLSFFGRDTRNSPSEGIQLLPGLYLVYCFDSE